MGRRTEIAAVLPGRRISPLPAPGHTHTERMERSWREVPQRSRSLLGVVQHPHGRVRITRGVSRAWRAGCLETCTPGSARGAQKPSVARRTGAVPLLYPWFSRATPIATSMAVVRPEAIDLHPKGRNEMEGGRQRLSWTARNGAQRQGKKVEDGRCRDKIESPRSGIGLRSDQPLSRTLMGARRENTWNEDRRP